MQAKTVAISKPQGAQFTGFGFTSGVAAAAPLFAVPVWGQIALGAVSLIGPLMSLLGRRGPSPEHRQIGSEWDKADKQVAAYLNSLKPKIDSKTLTIDEYAQAQALVDELGRLAAQQSAVDYVNKQWAMEKVNYQKWFDLAGPAVLLSAEDMQRINDAEKAKTSGGAQSVSSGDNSTGIIVLLGLGLVALKLMKG